jgi:hypothetical protein
MTRFPFLAASWAAALVVGFAVVLVLGAPAMPVADQLEAAMHPATPVTQPIAESSAATIVHLGYPEFESASRSTVKATDFGVEHWIVSYSDTTAETPRGLRISIVIATGHVEVSQFP